MTIPSNRLRLVSLLALAVSLFLSATSLRAYDGQDEYASFSNCSDGRKWVLEFSHK